MSTKATGSTISTILNQIRQMQNDHNQDFQHIPFVCVTYAQSIDGMIALASQVSQSLSSNLKLSCKESFLLTHALRSIHDGILIGGNTLVTDNPRLNNRLWKEENMDAESFSKQPIPIILDTELRHIRALMEMETDINCLNSHKNIIVCCSQQSKYKFEKAIQNYANVRGVVISLIACDVNHTNSNRKSVLELESVLKELYSQYRIKSIMVEGGASILSAFLSQNGLDLVNALCVTVCPKVIGGKAGLGALSVSSFERQIDGDEKDGENATVTNHGILDLTEKGTCKFYSLGCDSILLASISN